VETKAREFVPDVEEKVRATCFNLTLTQPLDDLPFASFKKALAKFHKKNVFSTSLHHQELKVLLLAAAFEAETMAFTP